MITLAGIAERRYTETHVYIVHRYMQGLMQDFLKVGGGVQPIRSPRKMWDGGGVQLRVDNDKSLHRGPKGGPDPRITPGSAPDIHAHMHLT